MYPKFGTETLKSLDTENGELKRGKQPLPQDVAKQLKLPALSSTDHREIANSEESDKLKFDEGTLPIETCSKPTAKSFLSDAENELDLTELMKAARIIPPDPQELSPESEYSIGDDAQDVPIASLPMEPLAESDFEL